MPDRDRLWAIPGWARHGARVLLPKRTGDKLRDFVLKNYYTPGMVSREGVVEYWWGRHVLHKRPQLHRVVVHITDHCNLNCTGCSHFSNIADEAFADPRELDTEFARLSELVDLTELYLLGGEPLLHPEIEQFVRSARSHFPNTKIILLTNGLLLPRMSEGFWEALGAAHITLMYDDYPIALQTAKIEELARKHGVDVELAEHHDEFLKTPIDFEGSQDAADSFARCRPVMNCPTLRDGRLYPCAYVAFIDLFAKRFDVAGLEPTERDSISIFDTSDPYEIMDFLLNPIPWCSHCDFDSAEPFSWGHSSGCIDEWTITSPTKEDAELASDRV